eukprot:TRINITY_DN38_c3_g1_i1.p1 TRINITY_DN38_c3_g1~~TRINITY_DN38_c3_g1_i1.p1  ORF type:complete len:336 (+),score=130.66 TRINITY_DN38_c3_g1_i1:112-1119(+)
MSTTQTILETKIKSKENNYNAIPEHQLTQELSSHAKRREILKKTHPEIEKLRSYDIGIAIWTVLLFLSMTFLSWLFSESSWFLVISVSYIIGASIDHALWVLIHELTHNTAFQSKSANKLFLIIANIAHLFPSGFSFRHFHRQHHSNLNEIYADPDVPCELEARIFSKNSFTKIIWLFVYPILTILRSNRYKQDFMDRWFILNWIVNAIYSFTIFHFFGIKAISFLVIASFFCIGLHPLGARWIAEHFAVSPNQETYSYYGFINKIAFNIGYHNEHHDLPWVPASRLPELRAIAPELYDTLYIHQSYFTVLRQFFFDPKFTLKTRVVREPKNKNL